ncbi:MAG: TVP38/TMEM64 family protein [Paracoccaceae bacterium]
MTWRAAILVLALGGLVAISLLADPMTWVSQEGLQVQAARLGTWGPFLIVAMMTLAIVASPIPSAPIALAAGAVYGHVLGTALVVLGAELGALTAFFLARKLGRETLQNWLGDRLDYGLLGSQNALTATVFITRLLPFMSFDLVSYAAGLSKLHFWRFGLATLAGIIPASFLLAHFGNEVATQDLGRMTWAVLGLGLFTGAPLIWVAWRTRQRPSVSTPSETADR